MVGSFVNNAYCMYGEPFKSTAQHQHLLRCKVIRDRHVCSQIDRHNDLTPSNIQTSITSTHTYCHVQIPYKTVEVNPLTKGQLKWTEYKKVPVAVIDGDVITDSTAIVSQLAAELDAQGPQPQSATTADSSSSGQSNSGSWLPGWLRRDSAPETSSAAASPAGVSPSDPAASCICTDSQCNCFKGALGEAGRISHVGSTAFSYFCCC